MFDLSKNSLVAKKRFVCPKCGVSGCVCVDLNFNLHFECKACTFGFNTFEDYKIPVVVYAVPRDLDKRYPF